MHLSLVSEFLLELHGRGDIRRLNALSIRHAHLPVRLPQLFQLVRQLANRLSVSRQKHHQQLRRNSSPMTALIPDALYFHLCTSRAASRHNLHSKISGLKPPHRLSRRIPHLHRDMRLPRHGKPKLHFPPVPTSKAVPEPKAQPDRTRSLARYPPDPRQFGAQRIASGFIVMPRRSVRSAKSQTSAAAALSATR